MSPLMLEKMETGARRKTALIVEGGAMRGAWAAGVLAYLQERGRRQYDLVYAASSGAFSAAYFVADIWEPGLAIWRDLASNVVRKSNLLRQNRSLTWLTSWIKSSERAFHSPWKRCKKRPPAFSSC